MTLQMKARGMNFASPLDDTPRTGGDVERPAVPLTRAERNIAQWRTYLPEDCVKTMIRMGWDKDT